MKGKRIRRVRTAEAFSTRLRGVMGMKKWPGEYDGLYFPNCGSVHTFFTFLALDIVFVDKGRKIIKIFPSTKSWRVYWGPRGTCHCLELPAGSTKRLGLTKGVKIEF
jgi:uncharacterized membrane protein (UPF0127 family)